MSADGSRINAIAPEATVTPINRNWIGDPNEKFEMESHIPLGHAGTLEEMATAAAFLATDHLHNRANSFYRWRSHVLR
jgi:glucose 1-dehydrogenase